MLRDAILLIEDDELDIDITINAFIDAEFDIDLQVCFDVEETVNFLRHEGTEPSLIILDINLPKMNGIELLKILKNDYKFSHIPVILVSSLSEQDVKHTCYLNKAASFVHKSNDRKKFSDSITKTCKY